MVRNTYFTFVISVLESRAALWHMFLIEKPAAYATAVFVVIIDRV